MKHGFLTAILFGLCSYSATAALPVLVDSNQCTISTPTTTCSFMMNNTAAGSLFFQIGCVQEDCTGVTITTTPPNLLPCVLTPLSSGNVGGAFCMNLSPAVSSSQLVQVAGCIAFCSIAGMSFTDTSTQDGSTITAFTPGTSQFLPIGPITPTGTTLLVTGIGVYCQGSSGNLQILSSVGFTVEQFVCDVTKAGVGLAWKVANAMEFPDWFVSNGGSGALGITGQLLSISAAANPENIKHQSIFE